MAYPDISNLNHLIDSIILYSQLKHEYGSKDIEKIISNIEEKLKNSIIKLKSLDIDQEISLKEPNELSEIKKLRPSGSRRIWENINKDEFNNRLSGALLGRFAGCTLGAPVEFWDIEKMELLAKENDLEFPPKNYWSYVPYPLEKRYKISPREKYTLNGIDSVPVDDDIVYTILGLLISEDFSVNFSTEDAGKAWLKYLPYACTAEDIALKNLKSGLNPETVGELENPYCEWIGAFIRSDPWGYLAPGWPEKAAEMAYRDAYISHRRQGIYGEMFFAATISAAFTVDDPLKAIEIGLTEIPKECSLAKSIRWALVEKDNIKNYRDARESVENKFIGMNRTHTINNACLVIFGLAIGGNDFTKVIGETVAMGMDNDCTAATAGSIFGATFGINNIPEYWYKPFNNKVLTYINNLPEISIDELIKRFTIQAEKVYKGV